MTVIQNPEEVKQPYDGCVSRYILMRHDEEGRNHEYLYGWPIVETVGEPTSKHSVDIVQVFAENGERADYLAHYQNGRLASGQENRGSLVPIVPEQDPLRMGRSMIPQVFEHLRHARQHARDYYDVMRPPIGYGEDGKRIVNNTQEGV
jgi:hypothetical protein